MNPEQWVKARADQHLRHGGKTSRRATIRRLINILQDIQQHEPGVNSPAVVGRGHVHRYYARHQHLAATTMRDHYYALALLWRWLDRPEPPPRPSVISE